MQWISTHLYTSVIVAVVLLLGGGTLLVRGRAPVDVQQHNGNTWSGSGSAVDSLTHDTTYTQGSALSVERATNAAIPQLSYSQEAGTSPSDDALAALQALAQKASTSGVRIEAGTDVTLSDLYALIPHGIGSATTTTIRRSVREQALFTYGNEAGAPIDAYGTTHQKQAYIIADFIADRANAGKQAAAARIGNDLKIVGRELAAIANVPTDIRAMHDALASSYTILGDKLIAFSNTKTDQELLASALEYNASVEQFNKTFLALATFFEISEVRFGAGDAGHVFTFSGQ